MDDILIFGEDEAEILGFKKQLSETFEMIDEGECSYYLGMHVDQEVGSISVNQRQYVEQMLKKYNLEHMALVSTPADKNIKLRKEIGKVADPAFKHDY